MAVTKIPKDWLRGGIGLIQKVLGYLSLLDFVKERHLGAPTFAVGAEGAGAANAIDVTVTLRDVFGDALAEKRAVFYWLSTTAGAGIVATAPTGGVAVQTGTDLGEGVDNKSGMALCHTDGTLVL